MTLYKIASKYFLRRWVTALRSGDYKQGCGRLKSPNGSMCCLGVACTLMAQETGKNFESFAEETNTYPTFAGSWLMPKDYQNVLANMNDGCGQHKHSFNQIADYIEATYLKEQNV